MDDMAHIKTERLRLRPLQIDDAPDFVALSGDFEVSRQTARIPYPPSLKAAQTWIASLPGSEEAVFAIQLNGAMIGTTGYKAVEPGIVELSYWLGMDYWGEGYAFEAARALIDIIFAKPQISAIIAVHAKDNPGSGHIIEKLGFRLLEDCICYSLARNEDVPCLRHRLARADYQDGKSL